MRGAMPAYARRPMDERVDVLVVGAGIAGLSAAAELATDRRVAVVEAEAAPATQTTGRSAAVLIAGYGGPAIAPFTAAGRAWFATGGGFADHQLLGPRGMLVVTAPDTAADGPPAGSLASAGVPVGVDDAVARFPALRPERVAAARHEPEVADIDVAGAVEAFRRALRSRRGTIAVGHRLVAGRCGPDGTWRVTTTGGEWRAAVVVDAAGAWGDQVAAACGVAPVGLRPLRRTACTFHAPPGLDTRRWPLVCDAADRWYVKPEPGLFLASPADETPSPPGDCRPEEADVARALDHVRENTTLAARSITAAWAGLRTFAPDRGLVLGADPALPTFVWAVGQGGFGIQTAPAAARTVASLARHGTVPDDLAAAGVTPANLSPARFGPRP
jgi:D-arginine dehydrogenase